MGKTIQALLWQHRRIYGLRNTIRHLSLSSRISFLANGLTEFEQICRGKRPGNLNDTFASIFGRIACVLGHFAGAETTVGISVNEIVVREMTTKYRPDKCGYCELAICDCSDKDRLPLKRVPINEEQLLLPCHSWQGNFKRVFGPANERRGVSYGINALDRELRELMKLESKDTRYNVRDQVIFKDFMEEIGDMIARLFGVANHPVFNIDIEDAFWSRYGQGCPRCHECPCNCVPTWFKQFGVSSEAPQA